MKITLRAAGSLKSGPERDMVDDYIKRAAHMSRQLGITDISEHEINIRSAKSREDETAAILGGLAPTDLLVVLDERGKAFTSRDLAKKIANWRDEGEKHIVFVIGGADGFEPKALPANAIKFSLGQQTWPHKLVRVMIAEQIYRALSILAGTPYHRD